MGNPVEIEDPLSLRINSIVDLLNSYKTMIKNSGIDRYLDNENFILRNKEIFRSVNILEEKICNFSECSIIDDFSFTDEEKLHRGRLALLAFGYMNAFSS